MWKLFLDYIALITGFLLIEWATFIVIRITIKHVPSSINAIVTLRKAAIVVKMEVIAGLVIIKNVFNNPIVEDRTNWSIAPTIHCVNLGLTVPINTHNK